MKKIYVNPEVSFLLLDDEDVIRTSGGYNEDILDGDKEDGEGFFG